MVPGWFHALASVSLVIALLSAVWIALDLTRHQQKMWIMNLVWPLAATFGSLLVLVFYWRWGRTAAQEEEPSFPVSSAKAALHCGAGCTLGDIVAEWLCFGAPAIAVVFGWQTLFHEKVFAVWIVDFLFAFAIGIGFQFFTIRPMRDLSVSEGLREAIKADAASLAAWQIGMYGMMAAGNFWLFRRVFQATLEVNSVEFWFLMQIAMLAGFCTAYPVNWLLIRKGIKEKM